MRFAHRAWLPLFALTWIVADPAQAVAGMPSLTLTDAASLRLQSISFFLSAFLVSSFLVRWIWNSLRSDFPRLPRLSYPRALALVGLWASPVAIRRRRAGAPLVANNAPPLHRAGRALQTD